MGGAGGGAAGAGGAGGGAAGAGGARWRCGGCRRRRAVPGDPHRRGSNRTGECLATGSSSTTRARPRRISVAGQFRDNDDTHSYLIPASTIDPAGGYFVLEEAAFGFGLGAAESARLYDPAAGDRSIRTRWTAHAAITYGRCPNGSGAFVDSRARPRDRPTTAGGAGGAAVARRARAAARRELAAARRAWAARSATLAWPGTDAVVTVDAMNSSEQPVGARLPARYSDVAGRDLGRAQRPGEAVPSRVERHDFVSPATDGWARRQGAALHERPRWPRLGRVTQAE